MKGMTILGWSIATISKAYLTNSYSLAHNRVFTSINKRGLRTTRMSFSSDVSAQSNYRAILEKEVHEKQMILAENPVALARMINDFYIPVYTYLKDQLQEHDNKFSSEEADIRQPLFIGISAPQVI